MTAKRKVRRRYDFYLSGPISSYGNEQNNLEALRTAAAGLRNRYGVRVFCPSENEGPEARDWDWNEHLRADIQALVACRGVVVLPNWERSKGCRLEVSIAKRLGMPVYTIEEFGEVFGE